MKSVTQSAGGGDQRQLQFEALAALGGCGHRALQRWSGLWREEGDGSLQGGSVIGADIMGAAGLLRPVHRAAGNVVLPAADPRHSASACQEGLAGAQGQLGLLALGDVAADRAQQRAALWVLLQAVGPGDPALGWRSVALCHSHALLAIAWLALVQHLGQKLRKLWALVLGDRLVKAGAGHLLRRAAEQAGIGRIDVHQLAIGPGQRDQLGLLFDQCAMPRVAGGQQAGQAPVAAAQQQHLQDGKGDQCHKQRQPAQQPGLRIHQPLICALHQLQCNSQQPEQRTQLSQRAGAEKPPLCGAVLGRKLALCHVLLAFLPGAQLGTPDGLRGIRTALAVQRFSLALVATWRQGGLQGGGEGSGAPIRRLLGALSNQLKQVN